MQYSSKSEHLNEYREICMDFLGTQEFELLQLNFAEDASLHLLVDEHIPSQKTDDTNIYFLADEHILVSKKHDAIMLQV